MAEAIVARPYEYDVKSTLNLQPGRRNVLFCRFAIFERLLLKLNDYFLVFNPFSFEKCKKAATKCSRDGLKTLFKIAIGLKKPIHPIHLLSTMKMCQFFKVAVCKGF